MRNAAPQLATETGNKNLSGWSEVTSLASFCSHKTKKKKKKNTQKPKVEEDKDVKKKKLTQTAGKIWKKESKEVNDSAHFFTS